MDFQDLVQKRYSCRHYSPEQLPDGQLDLVLEAARLAPTAANLQPFQVLVISTPGREEELLAIYRKDWFVQPPVVLGVIALPDQGWRRKKYDNAPYALVDASIVMDHITLQAADLGLGTCWIGAFDPQAAREILKLPDQVEPVAFTPLGLPLDSPKPKSRKSIEELIRYEQW